MTLMPWILGSDRDDVLTDTDWEDFVTPLRGNDVVYLGPGRDIIEINPGDGLDHIIGFRGGEDTVVIENFAAIDSTDDLDPFITDDDVDNSTTLDLAAAAGFAPGSQTLKFSNGQGLFLSDFLINRGAIPFPETLDLSLLGPADPTDPDFVPFPPNHPSYHGILENPGPIRIPLPPPKEDPPPDPVPVRPEDPPLIDHGPNLFPVPDF
jgi:hypothetical protein